MAFPIHVDSGVVKPAYFFWILRFGLLAFWIWLIDEPLLKELFPNGHFGIARKSIPSLLMMGLPLLFLLRTCLYPVCIRYHVRARCFTIYRLYGYRTYTTDSLAGFYRFNRTQSRGNHTEENCILKFRSGRKLRLTEKNLQSLGNFKHFLYACGVERLGDKYPV